MAHAFPSMVKGKGGTFMGKSMKLGGGGRFAKLKSELEAKGKSEESAGAIVATVGRKKLGKKRFQKMAAAGRKRAARP